MTVRVADKTGAGEGSCLPVLEGPQWLLDLFRTVAEKGASDLHLRVPSPPVLRVDGEVVPHSELPCMAPDDVEEAFCHITTTEQRLVFEDELELDFAIDVPGLARFRVNALRQRGTTSLAFRMVPFEIPSIDKLGLPQVFKTLALKRRGLILVTGPTGSGKSTTLAAMVDYLNENCGRNIVTIEDPIEFVHKNKKSLIAQRNLGNDTKSFSAALNHALRHDVDTIVIGEIRDLDTINAAMMAAETGHTVFGTLHTVDAVRSIDRVVDICPADQRRELRVRLSQVLEAILSQALLPRVGGGRVAAFEIMIANGAIRDIIRDERTAELPRNMGLSSKEEGMQTMDQALADLVKKGIVRREDATARTSNLRQLNNLLLDAQLSGKVS
jgi:twitching motility protein PilT